MVGADDSSPAHREQHPTLVISGSLENVDANIVKMPELPRK
jgi:hypothetical protein